MGTCGLSRVLLWVGKRAVKLGGKAHHNPYAATPPAISDSRRLYFAALGVGNWFIGQSVANSQLTRALTPPQLSPISTSS